MPNFLGRGPRLATAIKLSRHREPARIPSGPPGILGSALPGQPQLNPDLVALAASLPTPLSHLELSGLGLQSLRHHRLNSFTLDCRGGFGAKLCSSRARRLTWASIAGDGQAHAVFGSPYGPACSTSGCFTGCTTPSAVCSPAGPAPPPPRPHFKYTDAASWSVTCSLAVPSSYPFVGDCV